MVETQVEFDAALAAAAASSTSNTITVEGANGIVAPAGLSLPGNGQPLILTFAQTSGSPRFDVGAGTGNISALTLADGAEINFNVSAVALGMRVGYNGGTGTVTMTGGAITMNDAASAGYGVLSVGYGADSTGTFTQSGGEVATGGALNLGVAGATGNYTLSGGSLHQGTRAGTHVYIGDGAGGMGTLTISGTGAFTADAGSYVDVGTDSGTGTIIQQAGTATFNGDFVAFGSGSGGTAGTGTYQLEGGQLLINSGFFYFGNGASGTGALVQTGGTLIANTASSGQIAFGSTGAGAAGSYTISGGTATFSQGFTLAASGTEGTVNQTGGTVSITGGSLSFGNGTGTYNLDGGTLEVGGANGIRSAAVATTRLNLGGGTLGVVAANLTTDSNFSTFLVSGETSTIDTGGFDATWNSTITGGGSDTVFRKQGTGILTLAVANALSADIDIAAGTLALTNIAALATASPLTVFNDVAVGSGAVFDISGIPATSPNPYSIVTIGVLSGTGTVDVGANALVTVIGTGVTSAFGGAFTADVIAADSDGLEASLVKAGDGTLVIDGMSMTKGNFYVIGGTLSQTAGTTSLTYLALGEGLTNSVPNPGILDVTGGALTIGTTVQIGDWGGTGVVNQSGGTVSLTPTCGVTGDCVAMNIGNQGGTGTYNLSGGQLLIAGGSHSIGRNATSRPASTGTLNVSGTGLLEISPNGAYGEGFLVIGDRDPGTQTNSTGTLNQSGGTMRFVGASSLYLGGYGAGTYNFTAGTLEIGGSSLKGLYGGGGGTGSYLFNFGNGTIKVIGSALTTSVAATLTAGTTPTIDTNDLGATWNGVLSGAGNLLKTGGGTLTLGGANSGFTGDVTVAAGGLALGHVAALSAANDVTLQSATLATTGLGTGIVSIGALNGTGTINLGNARLQVNVATAAAFSGTITANFTSNSGNNYGRFDKTGAGTLTINDTVMTDPVVGSGGEFYVTQGTLALTAGTTAIPYLDVGSGTSSGNPNVGRMTISGGSLTVQRTFSIGAWGGTGTVDQSAGTVFIPDPGSCVSCGGLYIGNQAGTGTYNLTGGTLDFTGGVLNLGRTNSASSPAFTGRLNLSGTGEIIVRDGGIILGNWLVNASAGGLTTVGIGDGIFTQDGGTLRIENAADFYLAARGDGTYNFNGGLLQIGGTSLHALYANGGGTQTFNFAGGTIQVLDTALVTDAAMSVNLVDPLTRPLGSVIDTNGLGATWTGAITGAGILTKAGAGTLTLGNIATTGYLNLTGGTVSSTGATNSVALLVAVSGGTYGLDVASGKTLNLLGDAASGSAAIVYGNSTLNLGGSGTLKVAEGSFVVGYPTGTAPTLVASSGTVAMSGASKLDLTSADTTLLYVGVGGGVAGVTGTFTQNDTSRVTIGSNLIIGGDGAVASYVLNDSATLVTGGTSFVFIGLNEAVRTAGTSGTLTLNDSAAFTLTSDYLFLGMATTGSGGGSGDFAGDGKIIQNDTSVVSLGGSSVAIGFDAGGTGTYELNGGTLTIDTAGNGGFVVGSNAGAIGLLSQAGGTLTANESVTIGRAGTGTYNVSGGTASFAAGLRIADVAGSTGTVNQTGGAVAITGGSLSFGAGAGSYNLDGGTLTVQGLNAITASAAGGDTLNFRGGTLRAGATLSASALFSTVIAADETAIFDTNGFAITWNSAISGDGGLQKTGTGTLTLAAADSFTGAVAVDAGTLALSHAAALGAANAVSIGAGATLDVSGVAGVAIIGALSGAGSVALGTGFLLVDVAADRTTAFSGDIAAGFVSNSSYGRFAKLGAGTLLINGATMARSGVGTGEFYVAAGTLAQSAGETAISYLDVGTGTTSGVPNSAALDLSGGELTVVSTLSIGAWGGSGQVTQTGGTLTIPDPDGCDSCGGLHIGNQGGTGTYTLSNGTLDFSGGTFSLGRVSSSDNGVSTGTLTIAGGTVNIHSGNLILGNWLIGTTGIGHGTITQTAGLLHVGAAGELYLGAKGSGTYNLSGGTLEIGGASLLGLYQNGGGAGTYAFNLGGGTIKVVGSALATSVAATLVADTTSTLDTTAFDASWSGVLSGTGALAKVGGNTLTLSGANTYSGGTTLSGGTLALGHATALGAGRVSVTETATLAFGGAYSIGNAIALAEGQVATLASGANAVTLSGVIDGAGGLAKTGTGTLTLTGDNLYSGGTRLAAGAIALGSETGLGTGTLSFAGSATLALLADLSVGNALILDEATTATLDTGVHAVTLSGAVSGGGSLVKTGAGTLTLSGSNAYSGATNVSGGTLAVTGTLSASAVTVGAGGTLAGTGAIAGAVAVAAGGTLSGTAGSVLTLGSLVLDAGASIAANFAGPATAALFGVTGDLTLDGTVDITGPALEIGVYRLFS
ncbi:beta strand repeat-containing protein, partial [Aquabacter spiritensis]